MLICVVGAGGREHALAVTLSRTADVVVAPGNPGIPNSTGASVDPLSINADLFVIGPEVPLVGGLADQLRAAGKRVFGPGADGARLEGSKLWMKDLLAAARVPTARFGAFTVEALDDAIEFVSQLAPPYVIKTDGLAAGKGVLVTNDLSEAIGDVRAKLVGGSFGAAGATVVIEEGLSGPEASLFALCDGSSVSLIPTLAQDHKRIFDGDMGPNTGGMGVYSPMPGVSDLALEDMLESAVKPTVEELRRRGIDYRGVLFAGFMLTEEGPKVLEYNIRFGDPETQAILPRLEGDVAALFAQVADGELVDEPVVSSDAMVTVVCASEGYPEAPRTGDIIVGIDGAEAIDGVTVFSAGVAANDDGALVTAGGRVLNVCGRGPDLATARAKAYAGVAEISWPGMQNRTDIGASIKE
ncbi:MAG: phosphoribosylamine--glycine ligase [Candidatus Poriferisodalaceae bacterium]|jgi:phosphoribosylamine--glycine ligase